MKRVVEVRDFLPLPAATISRSPQWGILALQSLTDLCDRTEVWEVLLVIFPPALDAVERRLRLLLDVGATRDVGCGPLLDRRGL